MAVNSPFRERFDRKQEKRDAMKSAKKPTVHQTNAAAQTLPTVTNDPAGEAYLDGILDVTKRFCATLTPSPSCKLPILISKVQALAIATEKLLRAPEQGKKLRCALAAVDKAESELYAVIDHLRTSAREFGWYDGERGEKPAAVGPLDPSGYSDPRILSIEALANGMAAA